MATILIVDDIAAHRSPLVVLLSGQGHKVIEAADGRKALDAIGLVNPDLIITDVLMPMMDGYELVRLLRQDPATSQIPVLFYTAPYGEREARDVALSNGIAHVLTKPADPERVLQIVAGVLAGEVTTPTDGMLPGLGRHQLRLLDDGASAKIDDMRVANARLRAVINITLNLAAERGSARLLEMLCGAARDLFGATYVTLGIVDRTAQTLQMVLCAGPSCEMTYGAAWLSAGDRVPGVLGDVVRLRRAIRGENPGGDPALLNLPVAHPRIETFLAAPLASDGQVYGWICLVSNEGRGFTDHDQQLVLALAGQVGHMYELEHEIAERKEAELALRHERDRAQRYLDTASVVLLALDLHGRVTLINRYGAELLGWPSSELLGADFISTCLPERFRAEFRALLLRIKDGLVSVHTNPILTRSGDEREIEWHNTLLRGADGSVSGIFSSGIDVTKRHRAIELLRRAEVRTQFALEAAGVGIWDLDTSTGAVTWSEELETQHGIAPGTFGGTTEAFLDTVHPDDRDHVRAIVSEGFASGQPYRVDYRVTWPDGSIRHLDGAGRIAHDSAGRPEHGVGISLDVTARHALQEQSQQTQKMEAVGQLAGGVAHDFNNLLTAILGYCELLLDGMAPGDVRRVDLGQIQSAGNSAADLTRQLLAFSRQEVIQRSVFDLNVAIEEIRPMIVRLIGEHLAVVVNPSRGPAALRADRGQVNQILMNLAVNARDAMPAGGTLTIDVSDAPPGVVTLTVSDTGTGMTPAVLQRLFEPFFTTKQPGRGTGIGLATVHGIVTQSGGTIRVDSVLGRGTSFDIQFPAVDASELPGALPLIGQTGLPAAARTILLVEDADGLRALARRLLERQGYTVLSAANTADARAIFDRHPAIDLLLTDVVMPGGAGPDLAQELCERRPALKVIYMSGYAEDASLRHGVFTGEVAFLRKPFSSAILGQKIRDVLNAAPVIT